MKSMQRVAKELQDIKKEPNPVASIGPKDSRGNDLSILEACLMGPDGSPYAGGVFRVSITIPDRYPMKPPKVKFETKIYHPNIDSRGNICLDILKDKWTPALGISTLLLSISSLLNEPNPNDPLDPAIGRQYLNDRAQYIMTAQEWTRDNA
ncbi:ubiquitin-conjugating enzyme E2-16 kDa-like [Tripterygium wilfordii]|nr:ubiquitin-conjugating enzyme E2-16 kDa-like [Tripterygium wilfordii]